MNDALFTLPYRNHLIRLFSDEDTESPREDDNPSRIWCWHPRYELGDRDNPIPQAKLPELGSWDAVEALVHKRAKSKVLALAPLYLYDHSGLFLKIGSFDGLLPQGHARFDTMRVGFIFVTYRSWTMCMGRPEFESPKALENACFKAMESDLAEYNTWLRGGCYRFDIEGPICVDSCGGFLDDMSDFESSRVVQEAKSAVDAAIRHYLKTNGEQLELPFPKA